MNGESENTCALPTGSMILVAVESVARAAKYGPGDAIGQIDFPDILISEIATSINALS
jgi:hypothetical protein